jgi:hypothetical protein
MISKTTDPGDLASLARSTELSRLIVWAGAGISLEAPTGLPLGFGLVEFSLDQACGADVSARLYALWARANEICAEPFRPQPFAWRPRLESVLGGLGELERDAPNASLAFLPAFTSFAGAPPNRVHFALASLILRGVTVFTANFDLCLQEAIRRLTRQDDPFDLEVAGSIRRYRLKAGHGEIVHFHGAADDPEYLGATLSRIKQGLPEPFPVLEDRLDAGALLMMVGYSASDSFDVNPYFIRRRPGTWPVSTLLFVQHEGRDPPAHWAALGAAFGRAGTISLHTGDFIAELAGGVPALDPEPAFDWQAEFCARLDRDAAVRLRPVHTCTVANALGINVDALDENAYAGAEAENPGYEHGRYHHLLAIAGRERGRPDKEAEHHRRAGGGRDDSLGYDYARGDLQSAREKAMPVGEILEMARTGDGELPWAPYTSMSAHARPLVSHYLLRPWKRPRGRDRDRVARLHRVADALGSRPWRGVAFVRQVATAWRFHLLLNVVAGNPLDPRLEERVLDLYAELADLAGFVSSYRDFAIARLLRLRYEPLAGRLRLVADAGRLARRSYQLARLVRDPSGERRARQLGVLLVGYALLCPLVPRLAGPVLPSSAP